MNKFVGLLYDLLFGLSLVFRVVMGVAVIAFVASRWSLDWYSGLAITVSGVSYMLYPMLRSFKEGWGE